LVWKTVKRLLRQEADASDCFQQVFLSALELSRRQTIENWPGLLKRFATTRALDQLRQKMRKTPAMDADASVEAVPSPVADAISLAQACELCEHLREALAQLPTRQSEVFCLRHLSEMSYEEISEELGISIDAVGVALHRARGQLRTLLFAFADEQRS
jgi:RNA polymerase sigma factor (sigma-70 family)